MDDTIAHYTGLMPAVDSVIPECAFLGRNRIRKTGRDDVILANFLCDLPPDTGIPVLEQRSKNSRQLLEFNLSTNLFPKALFVECPDGHMTHVYLACDVHSTCFALDSSTSVSCPAPLTPLPPSFTCNNGVQHVPYTLVCDHCSDCSDRSDERFCVFTPCNVTSQFQCRNQQVICSASSTSLFLPPPPPPPPTPLCFLLVTFYCIHFMCFSAYWICCLILYIYCRSMAVILFKEDFIQIQNKDTASAS